jgi:hypothetical protein
MPPIASSPLVPYSALNHKLQISWALPDLNRERQLSVPTAGPQLSSVQWALPLPYQISGGQGFRGAFADFRVTSIENCE